MGRRRSLLSTRRRYRSTGGEAAILLLLVAVAAIALLGVWLLLIGLVAFATWLIAKVARQTKSAATGASLIAADPGVPSRVPPPNEQYHAVLDVDPVAFDDQVLAEATARRVFAAWARQLPKAPRDASGTIHALTLRTRLVGRLTTRLEGRRFAWRSRPYDGRDRPTLPPDVGALDPWNPPPNLSQVTRHIVDCAACAGRGTVHCPTCGASGRVTCRNCDGVGKYHGTTASGARRLLNCKGCRGKGSVVCTAGCVKGSVDCRACLRCGRLERWLEVEGGARDGDVQVEPDGDATRAFHWGKDGVPATEEQVARDAKVVCRVRDDRVLTPDDLPAEVPAGWRTANWERIQARIEPGEKVVSQTFELLRIPSIEVEYGLGAERQIVALEGLRMLAPPVTDDRLFAGRASSLRILGVSLGLLPVAMLIVYAARGSYYVTPLLAGMVGAMILLGGIVYATLWHSSLGRRTARKWLATAALPLAAIAGLAIVAEPSLARAKRYVAAGDVQAAARELSALGPRTDPKLASLWNDLRLRQVMVEADADRAAAWAGDLAPDTSQFNTGWAHVDELRLNAARAAIAAGDVKGARASLDQVTRPAAQAARTTLLDDLYIAEWRGCVKEEDWPCAADYLEKADTGRLGDAGATARSETLAALQARTSALVDAAAHEADLERRVAALAAAERVWSMQMQAERKPAPVALLTLRAEYQHEAANLAKQQEATRRRLEAEAKKRRAAEEREHKRQQAAAERERKREEAEARRREREPTRLQCCDGSISPSCSCGGSRRGCCSHHGGVCGCI